MAYPLVAIGGAYLVYLLAINPWRPLRAAPPAMRIRHTVAVAAWVAWVATMLMLLALSGSPSLRGGVEKRIQGLMKGIVSALEK